MLRDPQRRASYDRYGDDGPPADPFGGGLGDIFEAFFGGGSMFGGQARSGPPRGEDLEAHVDLDLTDVVFGTDTEVSVKTAVRCEDCDGTGAAEGAARHLRRLWRRRSGPSGSPVGARPDGHGGGVHDLRWARSHHRRPVPHLRRAGPHDREPHVRVEVPAGVDDGTTLRLSGRGAAGPRGGPHGDLYVQVHVRPHPTFRREGNDLVHDFYIPFTQAVLGAELDYETLDGDEKLVIPRATESGTEFRMRGRGVPHVRGRGRGDLRVRVFIDVPDQIPEVQENLLREFAAMREEPVAEPGQSLFGRIKSAFS